MERITDIISFDCKNGYRVEVDPSASRIMTLGPAQKTVQICDKRFANCDLSCPIRRLTFPVRSRNIEHRD